MTDYKEYAKQMRENAVKNEQGNIVCSPELWEEIASIIERAILPPCKVGETVYFIYETYDEEGINRCVLDCKVEQLGIDSKSTWFQLKLPLGVKLSGYFRNNKFGKTVFLTKEQAEEKLKELKDNA